MDTIQIKEEDVIEVYRKMDIERRKRKYADVKEEGRQNSYFESIPCKLELGLLGIFEKDLAVYDAKKIIDHNNSIKELYSLNE
jgi:hypothetical protein